jgi:hypothetical protein
VPACGAAGFAATPSAAAFEAPPASVATIRRAGPPRPHPPLHRSRVKEKNQINKS